MKKLILLAMLLLLFGCTSQTPTEENIANSQVEEIKQIKSPHFVDSSPYHGETYAITPKKLVINFDFDVATPSKIQVFANGKNIAIGETKVSEDKLSLETALDSQAGDGLYRVEYKACWPDKSCHDGKFYFTVNRSTIKDYSDMTGKKEVTINMKNIAFQPRSIKVSKNTKVIFLNEDPVTHYVNSDPHPSHNYLERLNSRGLDKDDTYNYTFTQEGEVHYHCSAHLEMTAKIIVVDDSLITLETKSSEVKPQNQSLPEKQNETQKEQSNYTIDFSSIRGAHFVSSTPSHGEVVSTPPANVTLNFNFDLHQKSNVTVTHDDKVVSSQTSVINKLILQTPLTYDGNGVYKVTYNGCWPDGSCHSGQFGFIIDAPNN